MKIFVISQPKAGTYLCANILRELGFKFNQYHFGEKKYEKYPEPGAVNYAEKIKNPLAFGLEKRVPLEESLTLIEDSHVGVGHLMYSRKNQSLLKEFKKIVLTRPRHEIIESLERWERYSGRKKTNLDHTLARCDSVEKWIGDDDVFHMTFKDMKEIDTEKIDRLQDFLKINHRYDSKKICLNALSKPSITKIIL